MKTGLKVFVSRQEFFSFYCVNFSGVETKNVPNLNHTGNIKRQTTALLVE